MKLGKVWAIYIAFPVFIWQTCIVKEKKKESLLLKAKGERKRETPEILIMFFLV